MYWGTWKELLGGLSILAFCVVTVAIGAGALAGCTGDGYSHCSPTGVLATSLYFAALLVAPFVLWGVIYLRRRIRGY